MMQKRKRTGKSNRGMILGRYVQGTKQREDKKMRTQGKSTAVEK
jgi:hypothetical protein